MQRTRLIVLLVALPFGACKCHSGLNGTNGVLTATPPQLAFDVAAHHTQTLQVTIKNGGDAPVNINPPPTMTGDTNQAFKPFFGDAGLLLEVGGTTVLNVSYRPTAHQSDSATVVVDNDTGNALDIPVTGKGEDPCFQVVCDAGAPDVKAEWHCFGQCDENTGACVYAGSCEDPSQCLSNGSCDPGSGACQGTSDCANPQGVCQGGVFNGQSCPAGTNCCNPGGFGTSSECNYIPQKVNCDCGCDPSGSRCAYQWEPATTPPPSAGAVSSVWASGQAAGDVWLAEITGQGTVGQNTVYQLQNGSWNQVAQVANATNFVCSGPGCGLILTGSSDQDVYGAVDCTTVSGGQCQAGGAWHWTGSAAPPETFPQPTANQTDLPITPILDIGGTGFALNTDNSNIGPELLSSANGWHIAQALRYACQAAAGALWGSSTSDIWLGWGCSGASGAAATTGILVHYNGSGLDPSPFSLGNGEYTAGMWGTSNQDIWAVGTHRWHYNGSSWSQDASAPPAGNADSAVWGDGQDYYAGGGYTQLYHWTASSDWTEECVAPGHNGPSITSFASDGTTVYATGQTATGQLYQRCPNGQCQ